MRALTIGLLLSLALGVPGAASAQSSKLAIGTIRGDATQVRRQILAQVCGPYQCVAASRYTTDDQPDPAKLAGGGVAGFLGGAITGPKGDRHVVLTLTTPTSTARKPARTWRLRVSSDGKLRPEVLQRFSVELDELLQASAARLAPSPAAPPQRQQPPAAKAPPAKEAAPAAAAAATAKPPPASPPPPKEPAPKPAQQTAKPPPKAAPQAEEKPHRPAGAPLRFAAEGGLWITSRTLSYSGATGGSLRTFDASGIFVPSLRLEVYPMAMAGNPSPLLAGLGLYVDYGHSVGLQVKPPTGSTEGNHDGTLTNLDLGAVWRVRPISGSAFTLAPALGYRSLQLVTAAKGGVEIDGLPDARLAGYEARLDVDAPVSTNFRIVAGGGYILWTQAKDLVKGGFFGKGSAHAIQLDGGLQYHITGALHVKGVVEYLSTSYSGLGEPANVNYIATGATDTYLGLRLMLRGEF